MDIDNETHQDERAISICAFAADLMSHLDNDSASPSFTAWMQEADISQTLSATMESLDMSVLSLRFSARSLRLLDSSGTALWNAFMRFLRVGGDDIKDDVSTDIVKVPLLVCRMLGCCCSEDGNSNWKFFQVLIRSAEICLGSSMIVEVTDLLRRATLKANSIDLSELADPDSRDYMVRYHFLCAWMALKNEDIKDFDVHFSHLPLDVTNMSPDSQEQYASICLSAFRLAVKHGLKELAESLLQKLSEMSSILRQCHHEGIEYKKWISGFFYVLATVDLKDMSEAFNNLRSNLLETTEQDLEGPLGLFLQLEVASRQEVFEKDIFYQILIRYIETMEPTKDKFKSPDNAMTALRLLYQRLNVFSQDENWLQQNFIVWKYIESTCSNSDYLEAQAWCRLCRNKLFDRASPTNKANLLRKTMDCSFQIGDYAEVKSTWEILPKEQRDPTTIHIMYQVSLRDLDIDTAASLLASLTELENGEHRYALAAVAAAVTVSSQLRRGALQSVQALIEQYPIVLKKPINLDLHRALIRLIVYELREDPDDAETLRAQMCKLLTWGECIIYLDWSASHRLLILDVCFKIIDMYPKDVGIDVKHEVNRRRISCNLLGILIDINMARTEQYWEFKTTYYSMVTHRYADIQSVMGSMANTSVVMKYLDPTIIGKYHEMLCFYLEAVIFLERWSEVEPFIRAASTTNSDHARSIMVDMILMSEKMPIENVIRSLQELLNSLHHTDTKHLSFIRCIFDLCLHHRRNDIRICETVLNQALSTTQDTPSTGENNNSQDDEIEYISTKAFNYAVDLYLDGQQTDAQRWARKAIELSKLMRNDYGRLSLALQTKYEKWLTYDMNISDS
ncbi:Hypothetical protein PENO1_014580 [Penicillium occitanis (nom. inval.)]|nr:Hypothetical protein PENO1_014580 [Penicillium occitanis (nom. inval.)]PCH07887.1 hypothetical protein PENOC_017270 [Penicillium occitanis (nom. inval.)]